MSGVDTGIISGLDSVPDDLPVPPSEQEIWTGAVKQFQVFGAHAPRRKRPKRLAKKFAKRGGMLCVRGPLQDIRRAYLKAYPDAWWMS